jgi:hypothetical protein
VTGIDDWLPTFDVGERHEIDVTWPAEEALPRALAAPAAPDGFVRLLFRLRGLEPEGSIEEFMAANGFTVLSPRVDRAAGRAGARARADREVQMRCSIQRNATS